MKVKLFIETVAHEHGLDPNVLAVAVVEKVRADAMYAQFAEFIPGVVDATPAEHVISSPGLKRQSTRDRLTHELQAARQALKSASTPALRKHVMERVSELEVALKKLTAQKPDQGSPIVQTYQDADEVLYQQWVGISGVEA